jgi:hypothetical protein
MTIFDEPTRMVQILAYSVGMSPLLIRSPKDDSFPTRIDVLFQNVEVLNLPTPSVGAHHPARRPEQERRISDATGRLGDDDTQFFVVFGGSYEGFVVAGVCAHMEDQGEYYEPSSLWSDG